MFHDWHAIMTANDPESGIGMSALDQALAVGISDPLLSHQISQEMQLDLDPVTMPDEVKIMIAMNVSSPAKTFHTLPHHFAFHRTFFVTASGYFGMGPEAMSDGDRIALFAGLKVPMLLRAQGQQCILLGPAYVPGFMQGERWPTDLSTLSTFTIL